MIFSTTRKCSKCGNEIPIFSGVNIDISCQTCGNFSGIFVGKDSDQLKFECTSCKHVFIVDANKEVPLYHDVPNCKNKTINYLGTIDPNEKIIINTSKEVYKYLIYIRRNRGMGDVLMTASILPELKKKYPDYSIWFEVDEDIAPVLYNNPYIDRLLLRGNKNKLAHEPGLFINLLEKLENYKENNEANKRNRVERIWELSGLRIDQYSDLRPKYYPLKEEIDWAKNFLKINPKSKAKFIIVGIESFANFRTWPINKFEELVDSLIDKSFNNYIILVGQNHNPIKGRNIINTCGELTIRELGALIVASQLVICGDTGLYHLAEAVGTPSLVLFGSIPPQARISTYAYTTPIYKEDLAPCIPCWDKQRENMPPCINICMNSITSEEVLKEAIRILNLKNPEKKYETKSYA